MLFADRRATAIRDLVDEAGYTGRDNAIADGGRRFAGGLRRQSPGGWRATNPAGPVPAVLQRGPVAGGLGGLPSPAAVSR